MGNDISANQTLQLPPLQLNSIRQLISKDTVDTDLIFEYNDTDNTAFISGSIFDYSYVSLPLSIKRGLKEYNIIGIKEDSFANNQVIISFQFPANSKIQIIGKNAFRGSTLNSITIPSQISQIGEYSFSHCEFLKTVDFAANSILKTIEPYVFSKSYIKYIKIPSQVTSICESAFDKCHYLCVVEFPENSELQIIEKNAFANTSIEHITIPVHVKKICEKAFYKCNKLRAIEFPENSELQEIGRKIFCGSIISSFTIPNNVVSLQDGWQKALFLKEIKIMKNNKIFKYYNDTFIVGKSNPESEEYDELIYAIRDIKDVVIPPFIKKICGYSFYETSIESVVISSNVEKIADKAFYGCFKLTKIEFSENSKLNSIGKLSLANCLIKSIIIPSSVTDLKGGFINNYMENLKISENNQFYKIQDDIIIGKSDPKSDEFDLLIRANSTYSRTIIPSFIKKIAPYSFSYSSSTVFCTPMYTDYKSRIEIGDKAFNHFKCSDDLIISKCEKISRKAFIHSEINCIRFYPYVTEIEEYSFYDCKISTIKFDDNCPLKKIGISAFENSTIKSILIPKSVTEICKKAFANCKELEKIEFVENSELEIIEEKAFQCSSIQSIIVPKSVKKIGKKAFAECSSLETVLFSIDSKLESIGPKAFYETAIKAITIPSHVKEISTQTFFSCDKLETIEFQDNSELQRIEKCAFGGTLIESITIPASVTELKVGWIVGASKIKEIKLQEGNKCFKYFDNKFIVRKLDSKSSKSFDCLVYSRPDLKNVIIPPFIKIIEPFSFIYSIAENVIISPQVTRLYCKTFFLCNQLKTIEFDKNSELKLIEKDAFCNCSLIEKIILPSTIEKLNNYIINIKDVQVTLGKNKNLKSENKVIFGKSDIKSDIYDSIYFVNRDIMKTLTIPPDIKTISIYSFSNCMIESITITPSLTEICDYAFYHCENLEKVEIPENSHLKKIGIFAFAKTKIKTILIPKLVAEIENGSFNCCKKLTKIEFSENSALKKIGDYAFSESSIESIKIPPLVTIICYEAFCDCLKLQQVDFLGNSLKIVESRAFSNTKIVYISFPLSLTYINDSAFDNCSKNTYIYTFNNDNLRVPCRNPKVHLIDENFLSFNFNEKDKTAEIIESKSNDNCMCIPKLAYHNNEWYKIINIKENAFKKIDWIVLMRFVFDNQIQSIGKYAFANSSIRSFYCPSSVTIINEGAFSNCHNLKAIYFTKKSQLKIIDKDAFKSSGILSITLPKHVTEIREGAFASCETLYRLFINKNSELQIISTEAFTNSNRFTMYIPSNGTIDKKIIPSSLDDNIHYFKAKHDDDDDEEDEKEYDQDNEKDDGDNDDEKDDDDDDDDDDEKDDDDDEKDDDDN